MHYLAFNHIAPLNSSRVFSSAVKNSGVVKGLFLDGIEFVTDNSSSFIPILAGILSMVDILPD